MGRDQVKRNQAARGRGRGGAGGGRGGGGGGAGGKTNSRRGAGKSSSSSSALSLGDNSHRYDHRSSRSCIDDVGVDEYEDDDDDDDGRMEAFDTAFAHYDASLSSLKRRDDDSLDFFADSGPTTRNNKDRNVDNDDNETRARNSWMEIDIKALDKCLRQHIPLHDQLHVPLHIASHIEERYGGNQNRKKTLAELRDESTCIVVQHDDDDDGCTSSSIIGAVSECSNHDVLTNIVQVDGGINEKDEADKDDNDDDDNDDDDDEDLEAWLDDVIS